MYPYLSFPPRIVCGTNSSGNPAFSLWTPAPSTLRLPLRLSPSVALRASANSGQAFFAQDRFRRGDIVGFCFGQQELINTKYMP